MFAETVAENFYATWISRYGSPKTITTDQGTQFESSLFAALAKLIGTHRIRTTAYHHAANGMIEMAQNTKSITHVQQRNAMVNVAANSPTGFKNGIQRGQQSIRNRNAL